MDKNKARDILLRYNAWRRYGGPVGEGPDCPDPVAIGMAIDFAIEMMRQPKIIPEKDYFYGG